MNKVEELKKSSRNATVFMEPNLLEDSSLRWKNKEVLKSEVLFNGDSLEQLSYHENLSISVEDDCVVLNGKTTVVKKGPRPTLSVILKLDSLNFEDYNRLSFYVNPEAVGYTNFYFHFGFLNGDKWVHNAPSLNPNELNHVVWEIEGLKRDDVKAIQVSCFMMGTPPEALPDIKVKIGKIILEKVNADYDLGWDVQDRIAFSHVGYFPNQNKIAIVNSSIKEFKLLNENNEVVLEKATEVINNEIGEFSLIDFSEIKENGIYHIQYGKHISKPFEISSKCYDSSVWKSLNFLRLLRCGEDVAKVHSACHLNCRTTHKDGRSLPNFGGWHDAGDVSQFEICTAEMAHALLDYAEVVKGKDTDLYERLLDEAKVGVNWILRTRFGDGERALAILYNVWRDNVLLPTDDSYTNNVSENGPFENFTAAGCEAKASSMFEEIDPVYAAWCKRAAIEDFDFAKEGYQKGIHTVRWGSNVDSQVAGHGIIAACELYKITNDQYYLDVANEYAKIVMSCQEVEGVGEESIKGFFYEDPKHKYMMTYEHRGHEQSPIHGLVMLMETYPNSSIYDEIKNSVLLYKEYVVKTIKEAYPYQMMPGHIYDLDKFNMERYTVPPSYGTIPWALEQLKEQAKCGRKIAENIYIRKFPVSIQRRGFHATLLSKTKAVSMIARVLKDQELKQIVIDQFEWMFGKNPFASSTMYGEGYNYHPLYVAFSPQMVGALPVGIETKELTDEPYWPMATQAVYKEIWGHTTGKYLWALADIISMENNDER